MRSRWEGCGWASRAAKRDAMWPTGHMLDHHDQNPGIFPVLVPRLCPFLLTFKMEELDKEMAFKLEFEPVVPEQLKYLWTEDAISLWEKTRTQTLLLEIYFLNGH